MVKARAVFVDRDGVINPLVYNLETGEYESPHRPEDFSVYTYVARALRRIRALGYGVFLISNQPSYAKGKTSLENIEATAQLLRAYSDENGGLIDDYYYCYHHPNGIVPGYSGPCECRKPGTLFLRQAAQAYGLDLTRSVFIGDQDTDVACGAAMGLYTIKIENSHSMKKSGSQTPDAKVRNLLEAARLLEERAETGG